LPHYHELIKVAEKDTAVQLNKKYLGEAYGYLATYAANQKEDYAAAISYFEKLLEVDPGNDDARKYIEILEKRTANAPH
jgi:cytochrome c-type biogenesis protein CcmH/NrfG